MQPVEMNCDSSAVSYPRMALLLDRERLSSGEEFAESAVFSWRTATRAELSFLDRKSCTTVSQRSCNKTSRHTEGWKAAAAGCSSSCSTVEVLPKPLSRSSSCSTIELDEEDDEDEEECVEVSDDECVEVSEGASSDSFCHFAEDSDVGGDDASQGARGISLNPQATEFLPCAPAPGLTLAAEESEFEPLMISQFVPRAEAEEFVPCADAAMFVPRVAPGASTFSFSAGAQEFSPVSISQPKVPSSRAHLALPMKVTLTSSSMDQDISSFAVSRKPASGRADSAKISVQELQRFFAVKQATSS